MIHEPQLDETIPPRQWGMADYFFFVIERLWIILVVLVAVEVYGFFKLSQTPDTYQSIAVIEALHPPVDAVSLDPMDRWRMMQQNQTLVMAMIAKLSQPRLYDLVAARPAFTELLPNPTSVTQEEFEKAKSQLARRFQVSTSFADDERTKIITIRNIFDDAEVAQEIVLGVLEEATMLSAADRTGSSAQNIEQLNAEIDEIRNRLSEAEESLSIYSRAQEIRDEIRASEGRVLEMQKVYLDKWPPLIQEKKHLELLQLAFTTELNRIIKSVETEKQFWDSKAAQMEGLSESELVSFKVSNAEARHNMINRDFTTDSKLYESLLNKVKLGDVASAFEQQDFSILKPPTFSPDSLRMTPMQSALHYGWKGLLAGVAIAFLVSRLDSTLRRVEDLERFSGLSIFSVIPRIEFKSKKSGEEEPEKKEEPHAYGEAFRTLLASINLSSPDAKTILITSSIPGEGKSTVSCRLAKTEIETNPDHKVIVIDLDLRRPRVGEYLDLPKDHKGVYECLSGECSLQDAIQKTDDGFHVITAGNSPGQNVLPNKELISKLLTILQKRYDRVIVDTAPILAVSDTLIISKHVDITCLVFRMWKTPRHALRRALARLHQNGTRPSGIIANSMPEKKILGQESYYYSYSNAGYSEYSKT